MLQNQRNDMHPQAQHGEQAMKQQQLPPPRDQRPQPAQNGAEATARLHAHIDMAFNRYLAAVRMCQTPPQHPIAQAAVKTFPVFRRHLNQEGQQYLDRLVAEARSRGTLPSGRPVQHNLNFRQPPTVQQQVLAPLQHAVHQQQQAGQNAYYHHPPIPQQQQQPLPQSQSGYSALLQAQRDIPVAPVSDAVRAFVNQHVPKYFEAVEYLKKPPKTCDPATRQKAHMFMENFDKSLPPEGHNYLMEIVRRVAVDKSAGLYD